MADIYWPLSDDMPEMDSLTWEPVESGDYASAERGAIRAAPAALGFSVDMTATWPMARARFEGLFVPWWRGRAAQGGCDNGVTPFWLRDPLDFRPFRWIRQEGQAMRVQFEGSMAHVRVTLPLRRLPQ